MSKYTHYTEVQKEQARTTDIVDLLRGQGEKVRRAGSEYELLDSGQKVSIKGNLWYHQYEQVGGDAIDFVRRFLDKSYPEAMEYLLARRGIDKDVLNAFARKGMVYESAKYHNAVFVGFDKDCVAQHAMLRGIGSESTFRENATNCKPEYSFHWHRRSEKLLLYI